MAVNGSEASPHNSLVDFQVVATTPTDEHARLGRLRFRGRNEIETPHFLAISSRGTIPHVTPDLMRKHTSIQGIYTALEDYVEKAPKPLAICAFPCAADESPLRRFIALQDEALLVLGPRRLPAVTGPVQTGNTPTSMYLMTANGFRPLEIAAYVAAVKGSRPDIVVGPADIEFGKPTPSRQRIEKMDERTLAWMRGLNEQLEEHQAQRPRLTSLWAPLLPVESEQQRAYLDYLDELPVSAFGGMALYTTDSIPDIPAHLQDLPRLVMGMPATPHDLLTAVTLGADLLTVPFVTAASNAGHAFTFEFPAPNPSTTPPASTAAADATVTDSEIPDSRAPLAIDLWSTSHVTAVTPLTPGCSCYTCSSHHRAYLHHLLQSKEMLAWVLLQLHNHHVLTTFFRGVRASLAAGTFSRDVAAFARAYASDFPPRIGEGPRVRGYQAPRPRAAAPKLNKPAYRRLQPEEQNKLRDEARGKHTEKGVAGMETDAAVEEAFGPLFVESESKIEDRA